LSGKTVGGSQVTALLQGDLEDPGHSSGKYHFGFQAALVEPWIVRLMTPYELETTEVDLYKHWRQQWCDFASRLKANHAE
jgi:hypothetical protein